MQYPPALFPDIHTHAAMPFTDRWAMRNLLPSELLLLKHTDFPAYSCGLHPWYLRAGQYAEDWDKCRLAAHLPQIWAIGETGLDRAINIPFDWQKKVFAEHIALSETVGKPLIIHCVRAYPDVLQLRKQTKAEQPWIFHGFQGNAQIAQDCWRNGCYLSFGHAFLHPTSKLRAIFAAAPASGIFLESDDRAAAGTFEAVVETATLLRQTSAEQLRQQLWENMQSVFSYLQNNAPKYDEP